MINFLLVAKDALIVVFIIINIAYFVPWTRVTSFDNQCLDGNSSPALLVAVDAANSSRVVAYDSRSGRLCETSNTGASWEADNTELPSDLTITSIAINSSTYLATDQGVYYQDKGSAWKSLKLPVEDRSTFRKIAVDSDRETLYLSTSQNLLYAYNLSSGKWDRIDIAGLTGTITDITINYDYRAVSTVEGIWYQQIGAGAGWQKYDFKSDDPVTITSIKLVHPLKSWRHYFYDPTDDDWFFAATERGDIYSGNLTEPQRLEKRYPGQISISSLAVNGYSKFSVKSDGLYCEQSWSIVDKEWWLYRMSKVKPCN